MCVQLLEEPSRESYNMTLMALFDGCSFFVTNVEYIVIIDK
jgi:hypothetical protein